MCKNLVTFLIGVVPPNNTCHYEYKTDLTIVIFKVIQIVKTLVAQN